MRNVVIVMGRCGVTQKGYGMRFERRGSANWVATWAFSIKESLAKKEGYENSSVEGSFSFDEEFPGCPYCSAKSWLNVFTESLHSELKSKGIYTHAICPGFTKTEFHSRCNQDVSGVPDFVWLTPEKVATIAWKSVNKGKVISIPGIQYKGLVYLHQYAPRFVVRNYGKLAKKFLRRGGRNS